MGKKSDPRSKWAPTRREVSAADLRSLIEELQVDLDQMGSAAMVLVRGVETVQFRISEQSLTRFAKIPDSHHLAGEETFDSVWSSLVASAAAVSGAATQLKDTRDDLGRLLENLPNS